MQHHKHAPNNSYSIKDNKNCFMQNVLFHSTRYAAITFQVIILTYFTTSRMSRVEKQWRIQQKVFYFLTFR